MGHDPERRADAVLRPRSGWLTAAAYVAVAVPFAVAAGRLLAAGVGHVYLADDLALIDLHTREALAWRQQLGVFDRYGWNHPGPSYFYLLSVAYRLLGDGARAMFVGATVLNGAAAVGCVAVVRRRTTPGRALWAAVWVGLLASVLAITGAGATTYSESGLGALVSPWNPLVVIFPLLLVALLAAAAVDRSTPSLVWAVVVASYAVQTDVSVLPLAAAFLAVGVVGWIGTTLVPRLRTGAGRSRRPTAGGWVLSGLGALAFVAMWVPPVVQQLTNQPGNLGLIVRFFRQSHTGQSAHVALWSSVAAFDVLVDGPGEVMSWVLGAAPAHAAVAVAVTVATAAVGVIVAVVAVAQRRPFAAALGFASVLGGLAVLLAAAVRVVGPVYGYLLAWAVVVPVAAAVGLGTLAVPGRGAAVRRRRWSTTAVARTGLVVVAAAVGVLAVVRVVGGPALATVSDPQVQRLTALTAPHLARRGNVYVNDAGAGGRTDTFFDVERFIGLVNALDQRGFHPTVNQYWRVQFGPGFLRTGTERQQIVLAPWTRSASGAPDYVGRVGDMAVTVTGPA